MTKIKVWDKESLQRATVDWGTLRLGELKKNVFVTSKHGTLDPYQETLLHDEIKRQMKYILCMLDPISYVKDDELIDWCLEFTSDNDTISDYI
jgi:hypothetical protein